MKGARQRSNVTEDVFGWRVEKPGDHDQHCDCNEEDDNDDDDYDDDDDDAPPPASPSHKYGNSNHGSILTFPGLFNFPFSLVTLVSAGYCF